MRLYTADALLTGASAEVVRQGGVLIDGSRIVVACPSEALRSLGPGAEVVELGAVTLLPGLIDAHVHLGFDGGPDPVARMRAETDAEQLILMRSSARRLLQAGVTTARDLGARAFLDIAVRDAIDRGTAEGPRLVTAARPLTPTGGHCWFMGGECGSADELRRMVRLHHKMGADLVKVMSTGGFMTTGPAPWLAQFTLAELSAVTWEAHRLGQRVAAHAHGKEGIARAVAAGVDTIEHCSFAGPDGEFGSDFDPALAEEIAVAGIFVCPTINVTAPIMRERHGPVLEEVIMGLYQHGVPLIAGTDAGTDNCPHGSYVSGLEALAEAGLPAARCWRRPPCGRHARSASRTARGPSRRARTPTSSRSAATRCATSPRCTASSWSSGAAASSSPAQPVLQDHGRRARIPAELARQPDMVRAP